MGIERKRWSVATDAGAGVARGNSGVGELSGVL